jgi:hypothetical protein
MELERIGFIPRSILRMLDRFYNQLSIGTAEPLVKQFRFSKYLLLTSVKSLLILLFIPLLTNFLTKTYVFRPLIEYFWDRKQTEIFLNFNLQERAFYEMADFEEKIYFESLVLNIGPCTSSNNPFHTEHKNEDHLSCTPLKNEKGEGKNMPVFTPFLEEKSKVSFDHSTLGTLKLINVNEKQILVDKKGDFKVVPDLLSSNNSNNNANLIKNESEFIKDEGMLIEQRLHEKTIELAEHYNHESREAITNLLADFMGFATLWFLLMNMKMSITNTTAFLFESFFSLKDSRKSFIMLLFTDLLVGFHSPRGWEVLFSGLFEHFGLPENENIILLLVGTFPVLLDALFKYWIFRHLNRHSPATVATYQSMVE